MNRFDDALTARLRGAFADSPDEQLSGGTACVPAERIWMAVRRELPREEIAGIVLHTAECGACADVWRMAHQVIPDAPPADPPRQPAWRSFWVWGPGLAAAAVLVLGVIVDRPPRFEDAPEAQYRADAGGEIQTLVADGSALPRDRFVLRWTAPEDQRRYDVTIMTEDLRVVAAARDLDATDYSVPAASLAKLPSGTRLLWQVAAVTPSRSRTTSPTFTVRVE